MRPGPLLFLPWLLLASASAQTTPLTLEAALARLAQSPPVTQSALSVQVAQTNLAAARTALGLSVSVTGNATYSGASTNSAADGTAPTASSLGGAVGAQVNLGVLPWASNQTSLRAAERALRRSQAQLKTSEAAARLNVTQQYFSGLLATQDLSLAERTLALRQRQLTVVQGQQNAGNATTEAVLSAQANVQSAQSARFQAQANLESARRALSAALGQELGEFTFSSGPDETFTLPDVVALVASARAGRTEVTDARNDLEAAQDALATKQRAATLPDLTANVRYGPSSGGLSASLNLQQGTAGVGYSLPLSTAGKVESRLSASISGSYTLYSPAQKAELSAAQATVTQAELTLSVQQQNVELDVRTKYSALQSALLTVQSRESAVQVSAQARQTAQARLQAGTATAGDISSAEITLAQAQRDLLAARISAQLALLTLQNAAAL